MNRDIVFFLGAGFSCDAGLKAMTGFGDESRRQLESLPEEGNKRNITSVLLEAGQAFSDFQSYCKGNNEVELDSDNMEEVFCIAEAFEQAGIKNIVLGGESVAVNDLLIKIKLWLWKIYQQCPPINNKRESEVHEEGYEGLVSFIKENNLASRTTAITTNYDLILEYFFWKNEMMCCYPIANPVSFSAGFRSEDFVSRVENANEVLVCKLHGSVNYFKDPGSNSFGICHDVAFPGDLIGKSSAPFKWPAIFALDSLWALRDKFKNLEPMIIPPTYAKLGQDEWLKATWNKAINALRDAKLLLFIGYSMPESDGFINAMLRAAFTLRKKDNSVHVCIVNPDNNVFGKYEKIFSGITRKDNFIEMEFSKAWSNSDLAKILCRFR